MNPLKSIVITLCCAAMLPGMAAHAAVTARWAIPPVYDSVEPFSDGMYIVRQNGRSGLIDSEGQVVVRPMADSITPMRDGLAAVATLSGDGNYRIERIVRDDNSTATPEKEFYLSEYPFFSEGLMPVYNAKGSAGYIDRNGILAIPCKYSNPHPFSQGLAAVSKGKSMFSKGIKAIAGAVGADGGIGKDKVFYINKLGGELKLPKEVGDIFLGTTFRDGEALVINKSRMYCIISPQGKLLRVEPDITIRFDEYGALSDGDEATAPVRKARPDGPDVFSEGAMTGYRQGNAVMLPAQFTTAEPFAGGVARAAKFGKWGLLRLVNGSVSATTRKGSLTPSDASMKSIDLEVQMPAALRGSDITVDVFDKNGKMLSHVTDADDGNGRHQVAIMVPAAGHEINVCVDGLIVWTSKAAAQPQTQGAGDGDISFAFSSTKAKANAKDNAAITVTLQNNTSAKISAPVKVRGAYTGTKKVDIAPGGSERITLSFAKISKKETRTVTITVGDNSVSRKISLLPFFTEF